MAAKKKKKRKSSQDKVFNDRPRKIFRHYISTSEVAFSVFFVLFTVAMGVWFVLQRDNYNPDDRDISMEVLINQQVEDHLWERPLERWVEPGSRVAAAGVPAIDIGVYPASTLSEGWVDTSRLEVFDNTDLYKKINGQETQYKAFGFQFLYFLAIAYPPEELEVNIELYDMGDFQNALGIFAAQRAAGSQVEKRGDAYLYMTSVGALGVVDKYYFKFTGSDENPRIQEHVLKIILDFAAGIDAGGSMPTGFSVLADDLGVDFSGIEYKPEDVFQYDFAKDFWFGRPVADSTLEYFVHEAESPEAATRLIEQILEEHQWDYDLIERNGNRILMQHQFLKTYFIIDQSGAVVFGVDKAPDRDQASTSLETIAQKLFDGIA